MTCQLFGSSGKLLAVKDVGAKTSFSTLVWVASRGTACRQTSLTTALRGRSEVFGQRCAETIWSRLNHKLFTASGFNNIGIWIRRMGRLVL